MLFDDDWYLKRYPDVQRSVLAGRHKSALDHYISHGRTEGRSPFAFDEDWYIQTNPDVREALQNGMVDSARTHYITHGRFERRIPVPPLLPEHRRVLAFGAYGTNNVGDEAIFEGIRLRHPNVIQIYHHKPTSLSAIKVNYALTYKKLFQPDSKLIIGGGGLLYSLSAVRDMLILAEAARSAGATVDILGLGCEGVKHEYFGEIRKLLALASAITVRTNASVEIIKRIANVDVQRQEDFAFDLSSQLPVRHAGINEVPLIGLVTGGDIRADFSGLVGLINSQIKRSMRGTVNFLHIPHSCAYDDRYNNDVVVGNAIWSDLSLDRLEDDQLFRLEPFRVEPAKVLAVYARLDGVMSARLHGMVFARMFSIPTLALAPDTPKNMAFLKDYTHPALFYPSSVSDLPRTFDNFLVAVNQHRNSREP